MFKNKKPEIGIPGGLALGILVSTVITLIGAAILAWLIAGGTVGEGSTPAGAATVQLISAALGALTATLCIRKMRLQMSLLSGLIYYLVLMGMNALFFDGEYAGMGLAALMVLIGCGIIAFLPTKAVRTGKKRRRAYR